MSSFGYDLLGFGSSANTAVDLPSDDEFNRVSFLSHFDGANNGVNNAFDDGSASNHTITANGNVTQGSFGPFAREAGYWGIDFANSTGVRNGLKLCEGYQTELVMTGTFTIEFWLFHRYVNGYQTFFGSGGGYSGWNSSTGHELTCFCGSNSAMYFQFWNGSAYVSTDSTAVGLNEGEWNHVAIVNNGGNWTTYLNGTGNTTTSYGNVGAVSSTGTWASYIGCANGGNDNNPCKGIMSNVRFVKGTAVYTSNFTPSTAPLTAITNTSSLVAQNNHFVDNSSHANTVTPTGNIAVSAFGPFLTDAVYDPASNAASAYFDGSGDGLTGPTSSDFQFGDNSFTVEAWIYPTVIDNYNAVIGTVASSGDGRWYISYGATSIYWGSYGNGGDGDLTSNHNMVPNAWHHLAYVRNKSDDKGRMYINGVQKGEHNDATTYRNPANPLNIGKDYDANDMNGYISDTRVVNGTAVYTSAFTPPTAPLTAITNTKLLLNMADGQAIDSAAQHNLTLAGNANTSTDQAKFGDTSLHLDGTGDWAYVYPQVFKFGTGDFTIEFQMRFTAVANVTIASFLSAANASDLAPHIYSEGSGVIKYYVGSIGAVITGSALSANQWYHIAVSRSGTSTKLFVDGTQSGSTYSDSNNYVAGPLVLGGYGYPAVDTGGSNMNGFIDEVRISKMARYTNNFTAPTAPFADKGQ